jgi:hypothetical protein
MTFSCNFWNRDLAKLSGKKYVALLEVLKIIKKLKNNLLNESLNRYESSTLKKTQL